MPSVWKLGNFRKGGAINYPEYFYSEKNTLKKNVNFDCKNIHWKIGLKEWAGKKVVFQGGK